MFFSRHIDYFMKVIETGSVMRAAEALFITPSAVRSSLAVLENHYGEKLLKREKGGLAPTAVGNQLYAELLPAYQSVINIMNRHGLKKKHEKPIKIYVGGLYYPELPTIVNSAMKHFSKKIELIQSSNARFGELKIDGCDLAIYASFEENYNLSHDIYKVHMSQEKIGALLSKKLLSEFGDVHNSIINTKLIQRNCFFTLPLHHQIFNKLKNNGIEVNFIGMPEFADILSLIQEGAGVTLISESILNFLPMNKEEFIFVNDPFSFPLIINWDIFFRREDYKDLIEIASFIRQ